MSITVHETGAIMIDGQESVTLYRLMTLRSALRLEALGLRVTRGPTALSILKSELGFKGSRDNVLAQLDAFIAECKLMHDAR
jgi:hypothetical protein